MIHRLRRHLGRVLQLSRDEAAELPLLAIQYWPGGVGREFRALYYRHRCKSVGRRVRIDPGVTILGAEHVSLGDDVWLDRGCLLVAGPALHGRRGWHEVHNNCYVGEKGDLLIGSRVHVGPDVLIQAHGGVAIGSDLTLAAGAKIYTLSHHYRNAEDPRDARVYKFVGLVDEQDQYMIEGAVTVGDGAAIGANSVLLPGTAVGPRTWVACGSVVLGAFPADVIVRGNPAAIEKARGPAVVQ